MPMTMTTERTKAGMFGEASLAQCGDCISVMSMVAVVVVGLDRDVDDDQAAPAGGGEWTDTNLNLSYR